MLPIVIISSHATACAGVQPWAFVSVAARAESTSTCVQELASFSSILSQPI